jgi:Myb-like DNA-binding domain
MLKKSVAEQENGENIEWIKVSENVDGRNTKQCRDRWYNYLRPGIIKGHWTLQEEEIIKDMYHTFGAKYVQNIQQSKMYKKLCHFHCSVFLMFVVLFVACFCRWCTMAKMMKNRSENDVKNKWYSMKRKDQRLKIKSMVTNESADAAPPNEPIAFDFQAFDIPMPDIATSKPHSLEDER